jgi:hypothetical protein
MASRADVASEEASRKLTRGSSSSALNQKINMIDVMSEANMAVNLSLTFLYIRHWVSHYFVIFSLYQLPFCIFVIAPILRTSHFVNHQFVDNHFVKYSFQNNF